jgi:hypothetical protein
MPPYDQYNDEDWSEYERQQQQIAYTVRQCANWRKEIFEHYTGLDAYADDGLKEMEKYLHGT